MFRYMRYCVHNLACRLLSPLASRWGGHSCLPSVKWETFLYDAAVEDRALERLARDVAAVRPRGRSSCIRIVVGPPQEQLSRRALERECVPSPEDLESWPGGLL